MKISKDTICEETLCIVREYYSHNIEPFCSALSQDCVWLGPGNLLISGATAIRSSFRSGFFMPRYDLSNPDFRLIEPGSKDHLIVLGQYLLFSSRQEKSINSAKQRGTFCWRRENDDWRLYHIHISNEWSELVESEVFPECVSRHTYYYVQKILAESRYSCERKLILKRNGHIEITAPELVLYIEAQGKHCVLYTVRENITVDISFKEIRTLLPPYFYCPHRSYLVNCRYVEKIDRYTLKLFTGAYIPIPKERYTRVRDAIAGLLEEQGESCGPLFSEMGDMQISDENRLYQGGEVDGQQEN